MAEPAGSPRVLWVTNQPPDRNLGGGSIRQAYLFEALARVYPVDLLLAGRLHDDGIRAAAANVTELPARPALWTNSPVLRKPLLLALTLGYPYPLTTYLGGSARRQLTRAARRCHRAYDVVFVEHTALAPVMPDSHPQPWVITLHNLVSGMMDTEADLAPNASKRCFRQRDAAKARRLEARAARSYERCITCAEADAAALRSMAGPEATGRVMVIPNGVDLQELRVTPVPDRPTVLFPATLGYPPNVDGARWFCSEVWPRVRAAVTEATLVLAGRTPAPAVRRLVDIPGVEVHADVPSMGSYFERARVVVVPLRVGTGTRLKALQAMAAGRPVIGTSVGLEGLGLADGVQGRIVDAPADFATAVIDVLRDSQLAGALGSAGRRHVEAHFGWERMGRQLVQLVEELLGQPAQTLSPAATRR
jgi:glycosyltransferase involved in cell wall biosynthesis